MTVLDFFQRSTYFRRIVVKMAGCWWDLRHTLQDGGFSLVLTNDQNDTQELSPEHFGPDIGFEQDGDIDVALREYTPAELATAIPRLGQLFKMDVPANGRLVLSTSGHPYWVGATKKSHYASSGEEMFDGVLGLKIGDEVSLDPHGVWRPSEVIDSTMPVIGLGQRGVALCPLVPAMLRIIKWGDVVEDLVKQRKEPTGYGWKYRVRFVADGTSIHGEWFRGRD